jgi:hypothetical protein
MQRSLLREIRSRLSSPSVSEAGTVTAVDAEFWTTMEARDRCLRIVDKIGGPKERRRVHAMFPAPDVSVEEAQQMYWGDSRYSFNYIPLLPLHVYESPAPPTSNTPASPFNAALEATCRSLLEDDPAPPKSSTPPPGGPALSSEIGRATATRANPKLTAHTVTSILWGSVRESTTLTANRTSVKTLLREMHSRSVVPFVVEGFGTGEEGKKTEVAAIWTFDPRSLAEGMRSDFVP